MNAASIARRMVRRSDVVNARFRASMRYADWRRCVQLNLDPLEHAAPRLTLWRTVSAILAKAPVTYASDARPTPREDDA